MAEVGMLRRREKAMEPNVIILLGLEASPKRKHEIKLTIKLTTCLLFLYLSMNCMASFP